MALIFCDGFDNYGNYSSMNRSRWLDLDSSNISFRAGRFHGQSVRMRYGSMAIGSDLDYLVLGTGYKEYPYGDDHSHAIIFKRTSASTTYTAKVTLNASTGIVLVSLAYEDGASYEWTQVAASQPGQVTDLTWAYVEVKVSVDDGVFVRVNGATVAAYEGSLSTTHSGGVSNIVTFTRISTIDGNYLYLDDLYLLDGTTGPGTRPMNDFIGDKRVATLFPSSNESTDWTPVSEVLYQHKGGLDYTQSISGGRVYLPNYVSTSYDDTGTHRYDKSAIEALRDCTLKSISVRATVDTPGVHIRPVVYTEDPVNPNQPLGLLALGDETTGLNAGVNVIPFGSAEPALVKGVKYWIGFFADAGFTSYKTLDYPGSWMYASATYPTPPESYPWASAGTGSSYTLVVDHTVSATNYGNVQEDAADTISYNSTDTLGDEDLFGVGPALSSEAIVYGVQVSGSYRKDDANARSVANLVKSGTTEEEGSSLALNADFAITTDIWVLNPDTSSEWTPAEVNAAQIGYKVTE